MAMNKCSLYMYDEVLRAPSALQPDMLSAPTPKILPAGNFARGEISGEKTPNFSPRDNRVGGFADKKYLGIGKENYL